MNDNIIESFGLGNEEAAAMLEWLKEQGADINPLQ